MPTAQGLTLTSQLLFMFFSIYDILLKALGIPYNVKLWEFGDAPNGAKGPNFTKINENGRVPAIGKLHSATNAYLSEFFLRYYISSRPY